MRWTYVSQKTNGQLIYEKWSTSTNQQNANPNKTLLDINLFGKSHDEFLDSCIRFIMDDDGSIGRENYADWLNNKKEVK